jgi:hypothetical protein
MGETRHANEATTYDWLVEVRKEVIEQDVSSLSKWVS